MFTGLIETLGTVRDVKADGAGTLLRRRISQPGIQVLTRQAVIALPRGAEESAHGASRSTGA